MKREPTLIYSILIEDRAVIALEAGASEARGLDGTKMTLPS